MQILALDPSSTCIGYAVIGFNQERVRACGRLLPDKKSAPAIERIRSLVAELSAVHREYQPDAVVVEMPTGKQYARGGQRTSGLPVWACAAGAVYGWLLGEQMFRQVFYVGSGWMRAGDKAKHQAMLTAAYPQYDPKKDTGADAADAAALGWHWIRSQKCDRVKRSAR